VKVAKHIKTIKKPWRLTIMPRGSCETAYPEMKSHVSENNCGLC